MSPTASTISISLISHTNVGKTTLARTLLRRDIGDVRDEAHVTQELERQRMIETPAGDRLELWDTPGFGDSQRLAKRLAQSGQPIGWFLVEVWDRFRDRAFWLNQRALRHVLEQADVVLYLVNAAEEPEDAAYLESELEILGLIGKPVLVLLNQLGQPRGATDEAAEIARWRATALRHRSVSEVLAFDAFARCWIAEAVLLRAIARLLPAAQQPAFERLQAAWVERSSSTWKQSMRVLAGRLARAAFDREVVPGGGFSGRVKELGAALGLRRDGDVTPREAAMQALAARLDEDVRHSTNQLIRLHGLDGNAGAHVLTLLAEHFAARQPVDEQRAAIWGGLVTGALTGLKADLASGGLTLGGGLLAGGALGALGAAGLAKGYNLLRGVDQPTLAWTNKVLDDLTHAALLTYLAVAHHGRGRGEWAEAVHPAHWQDQVDAALQPHHEHLHALWERARNAGDDAERRSVQAHLQDFLADRSAELLLAMYPLARPEDLGRAPAGTRSIGSGPVDTRDAAAG
ncbi:GTPase domain-containing protein [Piscinibacter sakaiensis]|uniref:GTPase domain-containing protein n=1 Tax=Piscinibacter sakaiensis TaxID=1547922 RepID=UPI003AB03F42